MNHSLARALRFFFEDYLVKARDVSPHTVSAYRQSFTLLADYLKRTRRVPSLRRFRVAQLTPEVIFDFLDYLEDSKSGRKNSIATRNARLAALKSFFAALPLFHPGYLSMAQRMRALPFKRIPNRAPDFLEREELREVFASIDRETAIGMRDLTLLLFMYNTGARASEAAQAKLSWLQLQGSFRAVRIFGKGSRERLCPLWDVTEAFVKHYLASIRREPRVEDRDRLFISARGRGFTRWSIWDLVRRRVADAAKRCRSLARKRITAHTIRHSLGVHLLQAGVDMSVIRSWLGHVRLETTHHYARVRIQDAQAAVERFFGLAEVFPHDTPHKSEPRQNEQLVQWLETL